MASSERAPGARSWLKPLRCGIAIPAHPLAIDAGRRLDERRQRALSRYYLAAGAGGLAVGVHSTQFEIREPKHRLLRPVLELAREEMAAHETRTGATVVKVAGICGPTRDAVLEAELAAGLGYDAGLLSLGALREAKDDALIEHARTVARAIPLFGFYLQPAVGGRLLGAGFWRRFAEIEGVVAVKIAPFNRYQTIDVVRAIAEAGRALPMDPDTGGGCADVAGIALYTGNDDHIVGDLLADWTFPVNGKPVSQRIVGGLLGHWAYWTRGAVEILDRCHAANRAGAIPADLLALDRQVTDMNAAVFDPANGFRGCIPGMLEVLRREGLVAGTWCLDSDLGLSPGQAEEISRVAKAYPRLTDEDFVARRLDEWLR